MLVAKSSVVSRAGRLLQVVYVDEDHRYDQFELQANGEPTFTSRLLPSVTQICHEGGLTDPQAALRWNDTARQRGTDVHDLLLRHVRKVPLDVPLPLEPYWRQVLRFLDEAHFTVESAEEVVFDPDLYAGRYDLVGLFERFRTAATVAEDQTRDLVDFKVGAVPASVGPQTIGYRRRLPHPLVRRWAVQITETGYFLHPLNTDPKSGHYLRTKDMYDERVFMAALTVANFKRQHHGR